MMNNQTTLMKIICSVLLCLHTGWVCFHMYHHWAGTINPWQLGGYGMYTMPKPYFRAELSQSTIPGAATNTVQIRHMFFYVTGGCLMGIKKEFYKNLIRDHRDYLEQYPDGQIIIKKHTRNMLPRVGRQTEIIGMIDFNYNKDLQQLRVKETLCDKVRDFVFDY